MTTKHFETLVPLDEFGVSAMNSATLEAWATTAGVELRVDYLDRHCVSLSDAYKLAESRRQAEAEYRQSESERHATHARAVAELRAALTQEFTRAREAALVHAKGQPFSPGEARANATSEGLDAARARWAAAPFDVRSECQVVEVTDADGTHMAYDMGTVLPRATIDAYLHAHARRR